MANVARRLERRGLMSRLLLRYHRVPSEDDGYHGAIRVIVAHRDGCRAFKEELSDICLNVWDLIQDTADEAGPSPSGAA